MYNVLLVEDEPPILFMVKAMIEASHPSFQVNNWALNGKEAWTIVQGQKPDVLITDIKMPFIGGLELITKVKELDPRIPCVVLTGYNDFEFVRDALRLQAFDYLLKPIKEEQLKQLLEQLFDQLARDSSDKETALIRQFVCYGKDSGEELQTRTASLPYAKYDFVLVRAGAASKLAYDTLNPGKEAIRLVQKDLVEELAPSGAAVWVLDGLQLNEKIIVIADRFAELVHLEGFAEDLLYRLQEQTEVPFHVFVGYGVSQPEKLREATDQLRRGVSMQTRLHRSGLYTSMVLRQDGGACVINEDIFGRCKLLVQEDRFDDFMKALELWSEEWMKRDYSQEQIESILQTIALKYGDHWSSASPKRSRFEFDANEIVASCTCIPQVVEEFGNYMKPFFEQRCQSQQIVSAKDLVRTIEHYLNTHYMDSISNDTYQSLFGYNKNYISNVFSEIMGMPPSKYLMKVRIQKAKSLIADNPDLQLKSIADWVGYEDPLYFSRVFKNETGYSPKDYKEMVSRQEEPER